MKRRIAAGAHSLIAHLRQTGYGEISSWTVEILDATTSERMVVAYTIRTRHPLKDAGTRESFIGKFFSDDTGHATCRIMNEIWQAFRKPPSSLLAIPQALHYDKPLRMLLQERASGRPFTELTNDAQFDTYIASAGRALAELHTKRCLLQEPKSTRNFESLRDHVEDLIRPHPLELVDRFPRYQKLIVEFLERVASFDREWEGKIHPSPIHRDFQLRQLFYDASRVWLIDWDLFAIGDAAFDVAYFLVYLKTHLRLEISSDLGGRFLEAYLERGPRDVVSRIPIYETFNYIRRACRRYRLQDDGWKSEMHAMLNEAEHLLEKTKSISI